jgi:hypothetical protein
VIFLQDSILVEEQCYGPHGQIGEHTGARVPLQ